nr:MAG TPA: hypothetical protein [Caudoviricetes sp.]
MCWVSVCLFSTFYLSLSSSDPQSSRARFSKNYITLTLISA